MKNITRIVLCYAIFNYYSLLCKPVNPNISYVPIKPVNQKNIKDNSNNSTAIEDNDNAANTDNTISTNNTKTSTHLSFLDKLHNFLYSLYELALTNPGATILFIAIAYLGHKKIIVNKLNPALQEVWNKIFHNGNQFAIAPGQIAHELQQYTNNYIQIVHSSNNIHELIEAGHFFSAMARAQKLVSANNIDSNLKLLAQSVQNPQAQKQVTKIKTRLKEILITKDTKNKDLMKKYLKTQSQNNPDIDSIPEIQNQGEHEQYINHVLNHLIPEHA